MKPKKSKTDIALAYLRANPGESVYAAAKHARMRSASPLYARIDRDKQKARGNCPECGRPL